MLEFQLSPALYVCVCVSVCECCKNDAQLLENCVFLLTFGKIALAALSLLA